MKHITDITIQSEVNQSGYTKEEQQLVRAFVFSVLAMYGSKSENIRRDIAPVLRMYAKDILRLSDVEYQKRLEKTKALKQAGHEDYKWPDDALAKATGKLEVLNHDYGKYYATGSAAKSLEHVRQIEHKPSDPETAKKHLGNLKGLFK